MSGLCVALGMVGFVLVIYLLIRNSQHEYLPPFVSEAGTLESFLVDPNTKLLNVYTATDAVNGGTIYGKAQFEQKPSKKSPVRMQKSGTGFRVWDHPELPQGKWLPCR